jgi:hypothetical protein
LILSVLTLDHETPEDGTRTVAAARAQSDAHEVEVGRGNGSDRGSFSLSLPVENICDV